MTVEKTRTLYVMFQKIMMVIMGEDAICMQMQDNAQCELRWK